jgi:hypothetical protein
VVSPGVVGKEPARAASCGQRPARTITGAAWFLMQIGMIVGFVTAYPMNWRLIRNGTKEAM